MGYFSPVPIYDDIGISTGAYANFSLAAALLRIAEIAPAAEILSMGTHSLLDAANARVIELSGLPFSVHGPFLHFQYGSRSGREHRKALDEHRRQLAVAGELGARVYVVHPDLQRRWKGWDPRWCARWRARSTTSRGCRTSTASPSPWRTCRSSATRTSAPPATSTSRGLGLSLDVGHAAVTGTLEQWLRDGQYKLKHVHLHDNEGHVGGDQHLPLGRGVVDAAPVIELARAHGAMVVLEHKNEADVIESLRHLEERGLVQRAVR